MFFFFQCVFGKNDGVLGLLGVHIHISPLQNSAHTLGVRLVVHPVGDLAEDFKMRPLIVG